MRQVRSTDQRPHLRIDRIEIEQAFGERHRFLEGIAGQRRFDGFEQHCRIVGKARESRFDRRTRRLQVLSLAVQADQLQMRGAVVRVEFQAAFEPGGALVIIVRSVLISDDQIKEMAKDQGRLQRRFLNRKQADSAQPVRFAVIDCAPEFGGESQDALALCFAQRTESIPVLRQTFVRIRQQTATKPGCRFRQATAAARAWTR